MLQINSQIIPNKLLISQNNELGLCARIHLFIYQRQTADKRTIPFIFSSLPGSLYLYTYQYDCDGQPSYKSSEVK